MKGTIKVYPEKSGLLGGRAFALEVWLDLTSDEKKAIKESGLQQTLVNVDKDIKQQPHVYNVTDFLKNSGPKIVRFNNAFSARHVGDEFQSKVEIVGNALQTYEAGNVVGETVFEC